MTISIGSFILLVCSVMTGLLTEAIKQLVTVNKPNIIAAIVSVVVGIAIPCMYVVMNELTFDTTTILYIFSIVVLSWLCSMLGYDKVMQTISHIKR